MAFELRLPRQLSRAGWKVKIRDKERLEEPHVTIIKGTTSWRVSLRGGEFLDEARWKDFPDSLCEAIEENWDRLCKEWDARYPHNPVSGEQESEGDDQDK